MLGSGDPWPVWGDRASEAEGSASDVGALPGVLEGQVPAEASEGRCPAQACLLPSSHSLQPRWPLTGGQVLQAGTALV